MFIIRPRRLLFRQYSIYVMCRVMTKMIAIFLPYFPQSFQHEMLRFTLIFWAPVNVFPEQESIILASFRQLSLAKSNIKKPAQFQFTRTTLGSRVVITSAIAEIKVAASLGYKRYCRSSSSVKHRIYSLTLTMIAHSRK
jgi:hypothetical protein